MRPKLDVSLLPLLPLLSLPSILFYGAGKYSRQAWWRCLIGSYALDLGFVLESGAARMAISYSSLNVYKLDASDSEKPE